MKDWHLLASNLRSLLPTLHCESIIPWPGLTPPHVLTPRTTTFSHRSSDELYHVGSGSCFIWQLSSVSVTSVEKGQMQWTNEWTESLPKPANNIWPHGLVLKSCLLVNKLTFIAQACFHSTGHFSDFISICKTPALPNHTQTISALLYFNPCKINFDLS